MSADGDAHGNGTGAPDGLDQPEAGAEPDAVTLAWQRAQAAARARGLRPGMPGGAIGGRTRTAGRGRGTDVTLSGAGPGPRDPTSVGAVVEHVVGAAGWKDSVAVGGVMGRWPEVVGPEVAEHCRPVGFADGVLTVRAATSAWATQLRMLVTDVRRRLDEVVGAGVVERIEVLAPDAPSWRRGRLSVPGRGVRDTYG